MVIGIQDEILKINSQHLLDRLLMDKTTKSDIIWATYAYTELGTAYHRDKEITVDLITGQHSGVIKNRAPQSLRASVGADTETRRGVYPALDLREDERPHR